jgi:hypothetical protein
LFARNFRRSSSSIDYGAYTRASKANCRVIITSFYKLNVIDLNSYAVVFCF